MNPDPSLYLYIHFYPSISIYFLDVSWVNSPSSRPAAGSRSWRRSCRPWRRCPPSSAPIRRRRWLRPPHGAAWCPRAWRRANKDRGNQQGVSIVMGVPSGKRSDNFGKSQFFFFYGYVNYKWPFSIAKLVYQKVTQNLWFISWEIRIYKWMMS